MHWIGKTAKMLEFYHNNALKSKGFNITKEQWVLLKVLSRENGISQNRIACLTERDKTTLTRLITALEKKGYIARVPSGEDKRINLIYITKIGEKMLRDSEQVFYELLEGLQNGLTEKEKEQTIQVLQKIQNNIKQSEGC